MDEYTRTFLQNSPSVGSQEIIEETCIKSKNKQTKNSEKKNQRKVSFSFLLYESFRKIACSLLVVLAEGIDTSLDFLYFVLFFNPWLVCYVVKIKLI